MGSNVIIVPVHLDAYFAEDDTTAVSAFADFTRLPYLNPEKGDVNGNHPFLDKTILTEPFDKHEGTLKAGLHLHWALPDALTRGDSSDEGSFPAVPNRWLVTCMNQEGSEVKRQWVVESDYLTQAGEPNIHGAISYPYPKEPGLTQPYRYLGRQIPYKGWKEEKGHDRLEKLTTLGYGDPMFAAFYPNCFSVFGAVDTDISKESDLHDLSYELLGWYADTKKDPLHDLHEIETLREQMRWEVPAEIRPDRTVCYAHLICAPSSHGIENPIKNTEIKLSIGNSGTEALSAHLASEIAGKDFKLPEEQLESLILSDDLGGSELDYYHRFKEVRHGRGFTPVSGSGLYAIIPIEGNSFVPSPIQIPASILRQLDELNRAMETWNQCKRQWARQRHLLYADWYKFMLAAYPEEELHGQYPDLDLIKFAIERDTLPGISKLQEEERKLSQQVDDLQNALSQSLEQFGKGTVEKKVVQQYLLKESEADVSGLQFSPGDQPVWVENLPFSTHCISLEDSFLAYKAPATIQAVSMWIQISSDLSDEATLFQTLQHDRLLSKSEIKDFWSRLVINGEEQAMNRPISWAHLPKGAWTYLYIEFREPIKPGEELFFFGNDETSTLKGELAGLRFFSEGLSQEELAHDRNMLEHAKFEARKTGGPRFWEPGEPVLFLEGAAAAPSQRHGFDGVNHEEGLLNCATIAISTDLPKGLSELQKAVSELRGSEESNPVQAAMTTWRHQPWHPLFMEWSVEVLPVSEGSNHAHESRMFDPDHLRANFSLEEHEPEFSFRPHQEIDTDRWAYQGRSILTPYAKELFTAKAAKVLGKEKPDSGFRQYGEEDYSIDSDKRWVKEPGVAGFESSSTWLDPSRTHRFLLEGDEAEEGTETAISSEEIEPEALLLAIERAWAHLESKQGVSQALSGFNAAMLMHHRRLQLPLIDPLGFDDHQQFTEEVAAALSGHTRWGCWPEGTFNPIRSGVLLLKELRLIDNFGVIREIATWNNLTCASSMKLPRENLMNQKAPAAWLSPRFIQPARLDFRWLDAEFKHIELNSHPESDPILGWIICNHLENSLAFYDRNGEGLGLIKKEAVWRALPGKDNAVHFDNVEPHLRQVVEKLCFTPEALDGLDDPEKEAKQAYFEAFVWAIDEATEFIEPEAAVHDDGLTHLIGHPMAITRAYVDISLNHEPVVDHGWMAFHHYLEGGGRQTDAFEKVKVPVRIGEADRLNDGVIGYWVEEGDLLSKTFQSVVKEAAFEETTIDPNLDHIRTYDPQNPGLWISPVDTRKEITLLMDPRAKVHAVTGILPVKSIDIPEKKFQEAMKRVSAARFVVRVLMEKEEIALPLRHEAGFDWSWQQKKGYQWTEVTEQGTVALGELMSTFEEGIALWKELLDKNWLYQVSEFRAVIVPADERKMPLDDRFQPKIGEIHQWLENHRLRALGADASFQSIPTVKEGWLGLNPKEV